MGKFKPTKDQEEILKSKDKNLLVSASAGSGKTATIIQKIFGLISSEGVDLENILVITFTEAASSEMKSRLKEKIFEGGKDNVRAREQLENLGASYICTLHSLCAKVLRKYFYVLDLNPNFAVLSEENANFLKIKALVETFNYYSKREDEEFFRLSMIFGGRNFLAFKKAILSYYDFLCSTYEKEEFKTKIIDVCYDANLEKNKACQVLNEYMLDNFYYYKKVFEKCLDDAQKAGCSYFVGLIKEVICKLEVFRYEKGFLENRQTFIELEYPKITKKKLDDKDENFRGEFKGLYKEFLDKNKAIGEAILSEQDKNDICENLSVARGFVLKFNEVEGVFEKHYEQIKKRKSVLDFNDLEKFMLRLFEDEKVLNEINLEFKYVFVDEYQDINEVQEKILQKLSKDANMVMVGDVKQSIYGFRNSTPDIFIEKSLAFEKSKDSGKLVLLNDNFRSKKEILNFVNAIFSKIMKVDFGGVDYGKNSLLRGLGEFESVGDLPAVKMCLIDNNKEEDEEGQVYQGVYSVLDDKNSYRGQLTKERKEATVIAKNIVNLVGREKIYDQSKKLFREVRFGDIAILGRSNEFLKNVCQVLEEFRIPISTNQVENIFSNPDVYVLLSLLRLISSTHDDISLTTVLTSVFGGLSCDELSKVKKETSEEEFFYNSVKRYRLEGGNYEIKEKLIKFFELIDDLREKIYASYSIYDIFSYLDDKFNFLTQFLALPGGIVRRQTVSNYIESFNGAEYNNDLESYLDYVKNFEQNNKFVSALGGSENSVKVGTIHSAKGLEYPIVFVCGLDKSFSKQTFLSPIFKDNSLGLCVDSYDVDSFVKEENLAKSAFMVNLKKKEKAEELRLLYVALTRAKNKLILVGHFNSKNIRRVKDYKDAENEKSYIGWVLSGLSDIGFGHLKNSKENFVDKQESFEIEVNIIKDEDFYVKEQVAVDDDFLFDNKADSKKFEDILMFEVEETNNIALKNTVSSMLQENAKEEKSSFNLEPKKLTILENNIDRTKLGSIYHNIMQKVDFFKSNSSEKEYLKDIFDKLNLEEKYVDEIDIESLVKCVKNIKSLEPVYVLKEQPFLSYVRYCDIFKSSDITDKILIQGVADLIVKTKDEFVLVDYKTNRVKNGDQLVEKYKLQLSLYKDCLEKAMNIKIDRMILYSFWLNKFVEVI